MIAGGSERNVHCFLVLGRGDCLPRDDPDPARSFRLAELPQDSTAHVRNGSLGVPVVPECSIATDKGIMPPAAFGLIRARMPYQKKDGSFGLRPASRIVLDHDTGGAIKGPGRADIFMGTGPEAGKKARTVYYDGELYYFLLKDNWRESV